MAPPVFDPSHYPVLIVDDEPNVLRTLRFNFEREFTLQTTTSPTEALAVVEREPVAVLVSDQRMPEMSGVELIAAAVKLRPALIPILLTGYTEVDVLAKALNLGCIRRYIGKPFDPQELRTAIQHAIEAAHLARTNASLAAENSRLVQELQSTNARLQTENRYFRQKDGGDSGFGAIIGPSPAMAQVVALARKVADSPATVLIEGPTGTGKEVLARAIHYGGERREHLFVAVNAGATPDTLLSNTLFGHRRGAFTGATADSKGLFEAAHGGTLFLDEIGEATAALQIHLLRVLQNGEILPVGATRPVFVDVRVVAATNRDLDAEVRQGRFREDLLHRLRMFRLRVPPLAHHMEDVPALAAHFVAKAARKLRKSVNGIAPEAVAALSRRSYAGNVRELENLIERAVLLCEVGAPVTEAELFDPFAESALSSAESNPKLSNAVAQFEQERILEALKQCGGNKTHAARQLGLTYRGFLFKLQRHGLMASPERQS